MGIAVYAAKVAGCSGPKPLLQPTASRHIVHSNDGGNVELTSGDGHGERPAQDICVEGVKQFPALSADVRVFMAEQRQKRGDRGAIHSPKQSE